MSLVSHDEFKQLIDIERLIKKEIPRIVLDGYEPANNLRESKGDFKALKPKKAKRVKPNQANSHKSRDRSDSRARPERKAKTAKTDSPWAKHDNSGSGTGRRAESGRKTSDGENRGVRAKNNRRGSSTSEQKNSARTPSKSNDSNASMAPASGDGGPNRKQRREALRAEYERNNGGANLGRETNKTIKKTGTKAPAPKSKFKTSDRSNVKKRPAKKIS
jgi:ATP-dependent RNA helicase RhlE